MATTIRYARDFGAVGDNVQDDTAEIQAALDDLPAYSGGVGGGVVALEATAANIYKVSAPIVLDSGQRLVGEGMRGPRLEGSFSDAIIKTATDGGAAPISIYLGIENLYVYNSSTNAAARSIDLCQTANLLLRRCSFQTQTAGGPSAHLGAAVNGEISHCAFGGGTGVPDMALLCDNNSNAVRFVFSRFTDAKTGLRLITAGDPVVEGCLFETLAGGLGSYNAAFAFSSCRGGKFQGNYFENCTLAQIVGYSTAAMSRGLLIGGNFMSNCGSPAIDLAGVSHSTILTNYVTPGANSPNAGGVVNTGINAVENVIFPQWLNSGTGAEISSTGGGKHIRLDSARVWVQAAASTDEVARSIVTGEAWQRYDQNAAGKMRHGSGAAAPDSSIERVQAGVYKIDKAIQLTPIAAGSVPNNSIFLDSADNVIKRKNNVGAVAAI